MTNKKMTTEQKLDLWKSIGRGFVDLVKDNKTAQYAATSLGLLALGKAKILPCRVVGTLQGVNTYIAISDVVEEGNFGFLESIAKGGGSIGIGALWANQVKDNCFQEEGDWLRDVFGIGRGDIDPTPPPGITAAQRYDYCKKRWWPQFPSMMAKCMKG